MPTIPTVSDYIPETSGDLSAGINIGRSIAANRQAAFERKQQEAQLAQQKQQHQQAIIAGLMERGVEPVLGQDGTIDIPGSIAVKKRKELAGAMGAYTATQDLSPAPEDINNEDFMQQFAAVKQARDRQQLMNEARIEAAKEATNRAIQQQTLRNSGAVDVQGLRNQGMTDRQALANDGKLAAAKGALEYTPKAMLIDNPIPGGKPIPVLMNSRNQGHVIKGDDEEIAKVRHKASLANLNNKLNGLMFMPKEQQDAARKAALDEFVQSVTPSDNAPIGNTPSSPRGQTAASPVKVNTKEERDALPKGTVYISPSGKISTKE